MPTTPNMNLILPTPTVTPGPTYAQQNNTAFETLDSHDHTTGNGVAIPSAGINVNADLPFNDNNATEVKSVRYENQGTALNAPTDIGCTYVAGGNLFFNDVSGTQIQLTAGGALNAASIGAIGGDYATSTASAFYISAAETFYFTSNTNQPANLNAAAIAIREDAVNSNAVTVQTPSALASSYSLTLPSSLPVSTKVLSLSSTGIVATGVAGTVVENDLATGSVTTNKIADANVTLSKLNFVPKLQYVSYVTAGTYTWTVPANVTRILVDGVGGGGGGGGGGGTNTGGDGGGAGFGFALGANVVPGGTVTIVVGSGGAGGNAAAAGSSGSNSSASSTLFSYTFFGGRGGGGNATNSVGSSMGMPPGAKGGVGFPGWGGGRFGYATNAQQAGVASGGGGAGGLGNSSTQTGGTGADGRVDIYWVDNT